MGWTERAKRKLAVFFVAGAVVFGLFVAAQFMNTGLPDPFLLAVGMIAGVSIHLLGALIIGISAVIRRRGESRRGAGPPVRMGKVFWEGRDPFPPLGQPFFMSVVLPDPRYAESFLKLNPENASASLDELRGRPSVSSPPAGMANLSESDYANAIRSKNEQMRDEFSDSWNTSGIAAIIILVFVGVAPLALILNGKARPPIADHPRMAIIISSCTIVACVGFFLRINAARLILAAIQFLMAIVATGILVVQLAKAFNFAVIWKLALYAGASWWFATALVARSSRRLCSRWGRLGRWFGLDR